MGPILNMPGLSAFALTMTFSGRLLRLPSLLASSQHSCLSLNVTTLQKKPCLTTLSKVVLPPSVMHYHIDLMWFRHRIYHNMKLSCLCICSLSGSLPLEHKEQTSSVLCIAHTQTGGLHTEDT